MEFIKAKDLKTVSNIMNALQKDVINSAMIGNTETQLRHKLRIDEKLTKELEKYLVDAGYKVYLDQGRDFDGASCLFLTLDWSEA